MDRHCERKPSRQIFANHLVGYSHTNQTPARVSLVLGPPVPPGTTSSPSSRIRIPLVLFKREVRILALNPIEFRILVIQFVILNSIILFLLNVISRHIY